MANEKQFKRWLKQSAPSRSLFTLIETSTGIGIPDVFTCFNGVSKWIECKDIPNSNKVVKLRSTQHLWLKKLYAVGGKGGLLIRHRDTIDYYDIEDLYKIPFDSIKKSGKDYILTGLIEPRYSMIRNSKDKDNFIESILE